MTEEQLIQITDLIDNFDFCMVKLAMDAVDYRYTESPWSAWKTRKVPTVRELKDLVFSLAKDMYTNPNARDDEGNYQIESYGFRLSNLKNGDLTLEFILTEHTENYTDIKKI